MSRWVRYLASVIISTAACVTNLPVAWGAPHSIAEAGLRGLRLAPVSEQGTADDALAPHARSVVVMDYVTGKVLYERDSHERLPMASITKIMTLLLVMEAIDSGRIKWTDMVKTSDYAASMGGSQIFLQPGERMSVEDLVKAIAMASANDACVAIAEHLAGSADAFVEAMNARAKQLGMTDTHFVNCNGLPAPDHYSSAHDIAIMSRELLNHDEITRYTRTFSDYLRQDTDHPFWLVNTNKLVRFYDGVDGLKTGYTAEAKYCLSATARRQGWRAIVVVMGEPKASTRNQEVSQLFNWAFANFTSRTIYRAGQVIKDIEVPQGDPQHVKVVVQEPVGVLEEKGRHGDYVTKVELSELKPPIRERQQIGTLTLLDGDGDDVLAKVALVAGNPVRKAGLLTHVGRVFRRVVTFGQ